MKYRTLGESGIPASTVAFGAWAIGGWNWGGQDEQQSIKALHAAIDAGINLIDTAPVYGFGTSERVVGRAIADRRDQVVLATKVGMRWDTDQGTLFFRSNPEEIDPEGELAVHVYCSPESVRWEIEQSLQRLKTDYIDLIQTHWQDETTPIADTMGELMKLKQEGKVRAIGACNVTIDQIEEYRAAGQFDTDQERYSMIDREQGEQKLPYCLRHDIAFLAYSPLANGLLTGKLGPERTFPPGDLRNVRPRFSVESRQAVNAFLDRIRPLAESHGITLAQLVIAWTLAQPGLTHALVGARTPQQAMENAAAADVELSEEEIRQISETIGNLSEQVGSVAPTSRKN